MPENPEEKVRQMATARIIESAKHVVEEWEVEHAKRKRQGYGFLFPTREIEFALTVVALAAEAAGLRDLLSPLCRPQYCTRAVSHEGPCDGWPVETCEAFKGDKTS